MGFETPRGVKRTGSPSLLEQASPGKASASGARDELDIAAIEEETLGEQPDLSGVEAQEFDPQYTEFTKEEVKKATQAGLAILDEFDVYDKVPAEPVSYTHLRAHETSAHL
eukprot:14278867-Alexandrium_andersonii.AAC.1